MNNDELYVDVLQNNSLLSNKNLLEKTQITQTTQTSQNSVSYMSIVDSIDYLGCINNNCSKLECNCKPNENCNCSSYNVRTKQEVQANQANKANQANQANRASSAANFISNLIDFLFIFIQLLLFVYIVYNRASHYLIYSLGITLIYIFYRMYNVNML
jgi:ATP-dependent Zn protease